MRKSCIYKSLVNAEIRKHSPTTEHLLVQLGKGFRIVQRPFSFSPKRSIGEHIRNRAYVPGSLREAANDVFSTVYMGLYQPSLHKASSFYEFQHRLTTALNPGQQTQLNDQKRKVECWLMTWWRVTFVRVGHGRENSTSMRSSLCGI